MEDLGKATEEGPAGVTQTLRLLVQGSGHSGGQGQHRELQ